MARSIATVFSVYFNGGPEPRKRPVSTVGDYTEVRDVKRVKVRVSENKSFSLLFDPDHRLEDRILNEQFIP